MSSLPIILDLKKEIQDVFASFSIIPALTSLYVYPPGKFSITAGDLLQELHLWEVSCNFTEDF